jgi:hypothetical protein
MLANPIEIFHSSSIQINNKNLSIIEILRCYDIILSKFLQKIRQNSQPTKDIVRIFLPDFTDLLMLSFTEESNLNKVNSLSILFSRFLLQIKQKIRDLRVVVIVSAREDYCSHDMLRKLSNACDSILKVESFAGKSGSIPSEFQSFHGFLHVLKLPQLGMFHQSYESNRSIDSVE